ncbi:hypothetical protein [Deinococcus sp. PEB2-63]
MAVVLLDTSALISLLDASGATVYRLAKAAEKHGVSRAHVYALSSGKSQPSMEALGTLIESLREVTGKAVDVGDLLVYRPSTEPPPEAIQSSGRLNRSKK